MEKYVLSTIQGCQTMETAYMFISGKTDKRNVAHPHSKILLSHKKE